MTVGSGKVVPAGRRLAAVAGALVLLAAAQIRAEEIFVDVGGDQLVFTPSDVSITTNDTVTFVNRGGFHNVVGDDGGFRCATACDGDGPGLDGSPSDSAWSVTIGYGTPGVYGFHCEVHGAPGAGMFGSVTVVSAPPPPPSTRVDSAPVGAAALLLIAGGLAALAGHFVGPWRRRHGPR